MTFILLLPYGFTGLTKPVRVVLNFLEIIVVPTFCTGQPFRAIFDTQSFLPPKQLQQYRKSKLIEWK